ncbi:MAG: hypothetical protein V3W11_02705 [bacterium]
MDTLNKGVGQRDALVDRLQSLQHELSKREFKKRVYTVLGLTFLLSTPIVYGLTSYIGWIFSIPLIAGFLLLGFALSISKRELDDEIRNLFTELDIRRVEEASAEKRAEKLFLFHQFELKRYYDQTLRQSRWVFVVGVSCIAMGFVIIGFTGYLLYLTYKMGEVELSASVLTAATGLLSAVLGDFIGYIYIRMYDGAVKSLAEFHERLVATHRIHFGNLLIEKMKSGLLHEETLARFALTLAELKGVSGAAAKDFRGKTPEVTPGGP